MKIALISDIHVNLPALEAVYHSIKDKNIIELYNLGDSLYGPLWPEETAKFLIENSIKSISGNEDKDLLEKTNKNETEKYTISQISELSISWLKILPDYYENDYITLFHGSPNDNSKYFLEKIIEKNIILKTNEEMLKNIGNIKTKYIGFGHSHLERILTIGEQVLINAGSVGLPAYSDENPDHKMETYNNFAKYIIIDNESIEIMYIPYDYKASSKRAKENNRNDWSYYIENGRVLDKK
jgi:predicted phosphodiesterase